MDKLDNEEKKDFPIVGKIGNAQVEKYALCYLETEKYNVIIVDEPNTGIFGLHKEDMNIIEINGVKYTPIEKYQNKYISSKMLASLSIGMTFGGDYRRGSERKRPEVNLIEEVKLIKNKESKLSRNDREWVVYMFESRFKKVD